MPTDHDLDRYERATSELDPPFALVDLEAFDANAAALVGSAQAKPIRLASKSVRSRALQTRALERPGFSGTLAFTLPEALWLAECGFDNLLVAYPTMHRSSLRRLTDSNADVILMVDDVEQLDFIERVVGKPVAPLQVCLDIDAGWWLLGGRVRIGAKRSPIHEPEQAAALARAVARRPHFEVVGLMAYEAQIAGMGDRPPGRPVRGAALRAMQARSARELAERRAAVAAAVSQVTPLRFVNGGGTGSLASTARERVVTEVTAGSGLFAPTLFDAYRGLAVRPAAMFALSVVRRPSRDVATVLGGGYLASGPADADRLPRPFLPADLRLDRQEGAGEVQTPLLGRGAERLAVGDRVYFRHAKAGELCERFDKLYLIEGDRIVDEVPTYRGEGRCFL